MKIAFQMDPLATINIAADTTFALMLEAQKRGHRLYHFHPSAVLYRSGVISAFAEEVAVKDEIGAHFEGLGSQVHALNTFDGILIRQDPPFDMNYYTNTLLLSLLAERYGTTVVNSPSAIRNISEKLSALAWPDLMADTFVGSELPDIRSFAAQHDMVVLKPLFLSGGTGVIKSSIHDADFDAQVDLVQRESGGGAILVQAFLQGVYKGDKRVMMLEGEIVGVLGRVPSGGDFRANLHVGGQPTMQELSERERHVCETVGAVMKQNDVMFAGVDLIDGYLNEINVTSPTLVRELLKMGGPDVAAQFIDALEIRAK